MEKFIEIMGHKIMDQNEDKQVQLLALKTFLLLGSVQEEQDIIKN